MGVKVMPLDSRRLYLKAIMSRYKSCGKMAKAKVLDEFCMICNYNRKYAIRILNGELLPLRTTRGRKPIYEKSVIDHLKRFWLSGDQSCSKKLVVIIKKWLPFYEQLISDTDKIKLATMSAATIDRVLKPVKAAYRRKLHGGTRPGHLIKNKIPIQTTDWNISKPGFLESDTVAHCGNSMSGDFIWSITYTDILTSWTENRAMWRKTSNGVKSQTGEVIKSVPFQVLGFDSDNGNEFLNYNLIRYFAKKHIRFTRSRPYKKNDNCHVEQKNWTHVRNLLGYDRFESIDLVPLINDLYKNTWCPYQNFFIPTIKLIQKHRVGGKIIKKYDKPRTPYERVLECPHISKERKEELRKQYSQYNPFKLKEEIEIKLKHILDIVKKEKENSIQNAA